MYWNGWKLISAVSKALEEGQGQPRDLMRGGGSHRLSILFIANPTLIFGTARLQRIREYQAAFVSPEIYLWQRRRSVCNLPKIKTLNFSISNSFSSFSLFLFYVYAKKTCSSNNCNTMGKCFPRRQKHICHPSSANNNNILAASLRFERCSGFEKSVSPNRLASLTFFRFTLLAKKQSTPIFNNPFRHAFPLHTRINPRKQLSPSLIKDKKTLALRKLNFTEEEERKRRENRSKRRRRRGRTELEARLSWSKSCWDNPRNFRTIFAKKIKPARPADTY